MSQVKFCFNILLWDHICNDNLYNAMHCAVVPIILSIIAFVLSQITGL